MPASLFSTEAHSSVFAVRLGRFEFLVVGGPARMPAKASPKHPGEVAFDVLGVTAYLLNHRRMNGQTTPASL